MIRASDVHEHAHGDVIGVLGAATSSSAGALQRGFALVVAPRADAARGSCATPSAGC